MKVRFVVLSAVLVILSGCGSESITPQAAPPARDVSVAAASDLKFALDDIVQQFAKEDKDLRVNVAYGSSGNFYSQLVNQAPFDMFLSADLEYPRKLSQQDLTLPGSEFTYAVGRIVVWAPASSPINVEKLQMSALKHPTVRHIAIANPQHAPYGRAAEGAMRSLKVYESVQSKLVFGENIAQTLQFIQSGNAEIGIVALSLAVAPTVRGQGKFWEVPLDRYPQIEQGGVILKWTRDVDAARAFRAYLNGPLGRSIMKKYGLSLPGE
jgi:molybdate transport system substrate-binding protein